MGERKLDGTTGTKRERKRRTERKGRFESKDRRTTGHEVKDRRERTREKGVRE